MKEAGFLDTTEGRIEWARGWIQAGLKIHPGAEAVDDVTRELLEAVKHIDNARKMLREKNGT